uniref:Uncharacterized protein n=1 Tax=Solanum lycopersicum TaxID=4081 RepID=K4D0G1_SOLLC
MAAWCLFKDKAGDSVDVPSIHGTTKDVAREFKGLPLAIIIVAGARKRKIKPSWEDSLRKLRRAEARNIHGVYEKVYKCLRRSYDHLGENEVVSSIDEYDKSIDLVVTETAPLGNWICHLLKERKFVSSRRNGYNNVLTKLQLNEFQNVKFLCLFDCDLVTHLSKRTHEVIKFPNLYYLELGHLGCLTHICSDNVERIEFPPLQTMFFFELPEFQNFTPTANNSNHLFDE